MRYFAEAIRNGKFVVLKESERGKIVGYRVMNLQNGTVGKKFATLTEARKVRKEKEAGKKNKQHPKRFYVSTGTERREIIGTGGLHHETTNVFYVCDRTERSGCKELRRTYYRRREARAAADKLSKKTKRG